MIEVGPSQAQSESSRTPGPVAVTFSIPPRPDIVTAALVGDFNGWSTTATMMTRTEHGFTVTVMLQPGRRYRFKYLLDGDRWENDWAADDYEPNRHGGDDSVVDLRHPRHAPPGTAVVDASRRSVQFPDSPTSGSQANASSRAFDRDRRSLAELVRARRHLLEAVRTRPRVEMSGPAS